MGIRERSLTRQKTIVANRAYSFQEAEDWDLDFWLNQSPRKRLSARVAIRRDVSKAQQVRQKRQKGAGSKS